MISRPKWIGIPNLLYMIRTVVSLGVKIYWKISYYYLVAQWWQLVLIGIICIWVEAGASYTVCIACLKEVKYCIDFYNSLAFFNSKPCVHFENSDLWPDFIALYFWTLIEMCPDKLCLLGCNSLYLPLLSQQLLPEGRVGYYPIFQRWSWVHHILHQRLLAVLSHTERQ